LFAVGGVSVVSSPPASENTRTSRRITASAPPPAISFWLRDQPRTVVTSLSPVSRAVRLALSIIARRLAAGLCTTVPPIGSRAARAPFQASRGGTTAVVSLAA
jgi:hypothetical protein